jgi:regulation of enolase protein 1 (concanavalin A-like superfamily)
VDRGTTEDASAELELVAGGRYLLVMEMYEAGGGASAYLRWSGPGIPKEIIPQGALQFVTWAYAPEPAVDAEGLSDRPVLSWLPGVDAVEHDVFLSTDKALVTKGDTKAYVGRQAETSFVPAAALKWNTTYYWRVDEVAEDGTVVAGDVWSFKVADYIPVIDGAVSLAYDNTADPFITELIQEYVDPQNFTRNGVTSLQLQLKGGASKFAIDGGVISLTAAGADIWGKADQFRYAFKKLSGDGSMTVQVLSNGTGSNRWAKGGVMVRQSLDPDAVNAFGAITGGDGDGGTFQWRPTQGSNSSSSRTLKGIAPPYWVRLTRAGNIFTVEMSADGETWEQQGKAPAELAMEDPVYIGLAVTSHVAGQLRTYTFDKVATTGDVTGDWTVADIGVAQGGNDPAPVYVTLVDSDGKSKAVVHPGGPSVTLNTGWMDWKILTSSFSGVNLKAITKVIVGVGDGQAGGTGAVQVADVRVVKPITIAVVNPSFEQPNASAKQLFAPPAIRFESVPGWSTDKEPKYSCIRKDAKPSQGIWAAFLWGGDPSIWQITDHTVVLGEAFQLDVDSAVVLGAVKDGVGNLQISLCYLNDAGKRVTLASKSFAMPVTVKNYSLSISSDQARAAAGRKLGIEIVNVRDNVIGVDNVRLKTK